MENSRENNLNERVYQRSSARESFRHLNASNRSRGNRYLNKSQSMGYINDGYKDKPEIYNEDKISKDFKRFLISAVFVATVVIVKILDFGFANSIEAKITDILRTSSTIDSKISEGFVSLGEKMGINIDELRETNSGSEVDVQEVENSVVTDEELTNTVVGEESEVSEENVTEEQITDFYIDDEVLESVFEDEKK